ncbi:glycosyltransferase family 2 protein [Candidatus Kaiserbacteria bacterium]|nr:glycosyltransferase family 2 protein [Candidatus Kaiserbacteria bacterium]
MPVYNSEGSLKLLHRRLADAFNAMGGSWELVLVNDCSRDKSWDVCREIAGSDARVTAINLTNNFGQHNATMCGLSHASGDYVITMDDDLQHPPEEIKKLVKTIVEGNCDVVYGQYRERRHGWFRNLCSGLVHGVVSRITGSGYTTTSFRVMKGSVARTITGFRQFNVMIDVLIKDVVNKSGVRHVDVEHHQREIGTSNYSFKKLFAYAVNMVFNYTLWPLRIATTLGLVFSLSSILLGVYFLADYLVRGVPVPGFTSLAVMITFFFGMVLFVLGVIGEYVGRMFLNINQKPQYFVKEVYKK